MFANKVSYPKAKDLNCDSFIDQSEISAAMEKFAASLSKNSDGLPAQDRTAFVADDFDYQIEYASPKNVGMIVPETDFWNANNDGDRFWTRSELENGLFRNDGKIHILKAGGSIEIKPVF